MKNALIAAVAGLLVAGCSMTGPNQKSSPELMRSRGDSTASPIVITTNFTGASFSVTFSDASDTVPMKIRMWELTLDPPAANTFRWEHARDGVTNLLVSSTDAAMETLFWTDPVGAHVLNGDVYTWDSTAGGDKQLIYVLEPR